MYQLEEKIWFWVLLLVPIVVLIHLLLIFWRKKTQISFANKVLLARLTPTQSVFKPILKLLIFCFVIGLIALALVNPKIGTKLETVKRGC